MESKFRKCAGLFAILIVLVGCGKSESPQTTNLSDTLSLSEYINGKTLTLSKRIPGTYVTLTYFINGEIRYFSDSSASYCYVYSYYDLSVGISYKVEAKRTTNNTWASLRLTPTSGSGSALDMTCYSRAPVKMFSYGDFKSVVGGYLSVQ